MAYIANNLVLITFSKNLMNPVKDGLSPNKGHKNNIKKTVQKFENSSDYSKSLYIYYLKFEYFFELHENFLIANFTGVTKSHFA